MPSDFCCSYLKGCSSACWAHGCRRPGAAPSRARRKPASLSRRILDISDAERRRIGQDLHDGLGQHLTGVAFLSKALQQRLAGKSLPEAADATKIAALVSESIGQTRALAKGLAPVGLEDGGLHFRPVAACRRHAVFSTSTAPVSCDDELELPDLARATHLYRIAQEAVNNAVRHGTPAESGASGAG